MRAPQSDHQDVLFWISLPFAPFLWWFGRNVHRSLLCLNTWSAAGVIFGKAVEPLEVETCRGRVTLGTGFGGLQSHPTSGSLFFRTSDAVLDHPLLPCLPCLGGLYGAQTNASSFELCVSRNSITAMEK